MITGTRRRPQFCIQKLTQYAEPRIRSSMIFGTDGHKAAGTNENETPRIAMIAIANPLDGNAGSKNAKLR